MIACFNYLCVIKKQKRHIDKEEWYFSIFQEVDCCTCLHRSVICHINHDKVDDLGTFKACKRFISANEPRIQVFEIVRKGERKEDCNLQEQNVDQYLSLQSLISC